MGPIEAHPQLDVANRGLGITFASIDEPRVRPCCGRDDRSDELQVAAASHALHDAFGAGRCGIGELYRRRYAIAESTRRKRLALCVEHRHISNVAVGGHRVKDLLEIVFVRRVDRVLG